MTDENGVDSLKPLTSETPPVASPVVSVPSFLKIREGGLLTVPITKSGTGPCSVTYTTKALSAKFAVDYIGVGPMVMSFGPDETEKTFTVQTLSDVSEDHGEKFTVELSNFVECSPGNTTCVVIITDSPRVHLPLTAAVKEGDVLTLDIVKTGEGSCSVAWETKQGKPANEDNQLSWFLLRSALLIAQPPLLLGILLRVKCLDGLGLLHLVRLEIEPVS